jgi:nitroreductase
MIDLFRNRRSIRRFEDRKIEPEKIEMLKEAVLRAPSARNQRSWEFVFVEDPGLLRELAGVRGSSSAFLDGAALGVVVMAREETVDVWIEDASAAAMTAQLAAVSLGLGSCWVQIRQRDHSSEETAEGYVRDLTGIPDSYRVLCILAVGYPAEEKEFVKAADLPWDRIHHNRYLR